MWSKSALRPRWLSFSMVILMSSFSRTQGGNGYNNNKYMYYDDDKAAAGNDDLAQKNNTDDSSGRDNGDDWIASNANVADDDLFHWDNNVGFDGVSIMPVSCVN